MDLGIEIYGHTSLAGFWEDHRRQLAIDDSLVIIGNNNGSCPRQIFQKECRQLATQLRRQRFLILSIRADDLLAMSNDSRFQSRGPIPMCKAMNLDTRFAQKS